MSAEEYIKNEVKLMKAECEKYKISPVEWIERYAVTYHEFHAQEVIGRKCA